MEPANEAAEAFFKRMNRNDETVCDLKISRNVGHHRKFFALLGMAYKNQDKYDSFEWMLTEIKYRLGHCDSCIIDGKHLLQPKSISFASMDQVAFERFYSQTIDVILEHFLTGANEDAIREQVDQIISFT